MAQRLPKFQSPTADLTWSTSAELVGLAFDLIPEGDATLFPQYAVGLHAWFLDQVRSIDPELSAQLHDEQEKKPFTVSRLEGKMGTHRTQVQLFEEETYRWYVTALSPPVVQWMGQWLGQLPPRLALRHAPLQIQSVSFAQPPTTYARLMKARVAKTLALSFVSPTSFRRKGHHLPLPWMTNVFQSYLRRWNDFSEMPFEEQAFLAWVDESVLINRHQLQSVKATAGKRGAVTGFTGAIELGLTKAAREQAEFVRLFSALGGLATYCGTGHKTTFGLGQTRLGWLPELNAVEALAGDMLLAGRIEVLQEKLMQAQKRTGGERARKVCQTRATILARQEFGESLLVIAEDLGMPYETVKSYAKRARRVIREG